MVKMLGTAYDDDDDDDNKGNCGYIGDSIKMLGGAYMHQVTCAIRLHRQQVIPGHRRSIVSTEDD